jgi:Fe2+ or Zn2+ uptake regulation protein
MSSLYQDASERLRAQGGRMTKQRRLILQTLDSVSGHPTAEDLFELVRECDPSLNLSTVYRTLRWLESEGFVSARRFDEDKRLERFDPALPIEHHHFICSHCKVVIEFDQPSVDGIREQFERQFGAQVENVTLVFYGLCAECATNTGES